MEKFIKEKIKTACEKKEAVLIQHTDLTSYQVTTDGMIEELTYNIISLTNCDCFGCSIKTELDHTDIIGNCDDLSFLQDM